MCLVLQRVVCYDVYISVFMTHCEHLLILGGHTDLLNLTCDAFVTRSSSTFSCLSENALPPPLPTPSTSTGESIASTRPMNQWMKFIDLPDTPNRLPLFIKHVNVLVYGKCQLILACISYSINILLAIIPQSNVLQGDWLIHDHHEKATCTLR